jgi:hypothetical protein
VLSKNPCRFYLDYFLKWPPLLVFKELLKIRHITVEPTYVFIMFLSELYRVLLEYIDATTPIYKIVPTHRPQRTNNYFAKTKWNGGSDNDEHTAPLEKSTPRLSSAPEPNVCFIKASHPHHESNCCFIKTDESLPIRREGLTVCTYGTVSKWQQFLTSTCQAIQRDCLREATRCP